MNLTFWYLCAAFAVLGIAIRLAVPRVLAWRGVWFRWRTRFGPALVFDAADDDGTPVRLLNVNGTYQSVCYVDPELRWDPVCEYHRSWAKAVRRRWPSKTEGCGRRALVMGGGGCSFPKWLVAYRPDFSCVVAEIDPAIVHVARERFFVDELEQTFGNGADSRFDLRTQDAWEALVEDEQGFDLIVNDAFRGNRPLGPMATEEGARLVRTHLRPGGMYVGNVRTTLEGPRSRALTEAQEAFGRVFSHVETIPERPETPRRKGNNALIAWDGEA